MGIYGRRLKPSMGPFSANPGAFPLPADSIVTTDDEQALLY
jgi:hypothetical protein